MSSVFEEKKVGGKTVNPSPSSSPTGILPYSQSMFYGADFPLVGSGEAYGDCGLVFAVGCLNVEAHKGMNLDGVDMTGKAVIKYVKNSCHRALCPKCWSFWANRECDSAIRRLDAFVLKNSGGKRLNPIHVIVSVSHVDYGLSLQELRKKMYRALKRVGLVGGMVIYHPKRKRRIGEWYFSPHFHVVGYGWIRDVRKNYVHSGYIVKNVGVRKNVRGTIYYQLSHAGVDVKMHTVTWFGMLSYNRLRVPKVVEKTQVCPLCGSKLRRLIWISEDENIFALMHDEVGSGFYFEDDGNWMYKPKKRSDEPEGCELSAV